MKRKNTRSEFDSGMNFQLQHELCVGLI